MGGSSDAAKSDEGRTAADQRCMRALVAGDRGALAELYDAYATLMTSVARVLVRDPREAEDLVHDVFLEAWKRADTYDAERGTVRTWLLMRLRSRAFDRRKSAESTRTRAFDPQQLGTAAGPALEGLTPGADPSATVDHGRVHASLAKLGPEQRTVLALAYFEGLTCSEIAEHEGIPIGTVKSRIAAALSKLRAELGASARADDGESV